MVVSHQERVVRVSLQVVRVSLTLGFFVSRRAAQVLRVCPEDDFVR